MPPVVNAAQPGAVRDLARMAHAVRAEPTTATSRSACMNASVTTRWSGSRSNIRWIGWKLRSTQKATPAARLQYAK